MQQQLQDLMNLDVKEIDVHLGQCRYSKCMGPADLAIGQLFLVCSHLLLIAVRMGQDSQSRSGLYWLAHTWMRIQPALS